jgi:acyl-CoA thioesterase-1
MLAKVLILADSLALPREGSDDIPYEATYPYLIEASLRQNPRVQLPIILERGMRRRTIEYVLDEWFELVELRRPDLVIIHVGIVDCAPRIFLRRERQFVENIRWTWLRKRILSFVHKHRARLIRMRPRVYVPLERFQPLVDEVIAKARELQTKLVFINILEPPDAVETRSPGFQQNVQRYNQLLESRVDDETVRLIDLNGMIAQKGGAAKMTVDGIHLNREAHAMLARELERLIDVSLPLQTRARQIVEYAHR